MSLKFTIIAILTAILISLSAPVWAQQSDTLLRYKKSEIRQKKRDSIRTTKKVWLSVLGGPSYTPEASIGVAGAVLASFRVNKNDTISQRSFFPMGVNLSINGTFIIAGAGTLFLNEDKFRIFTSYGFRKEPSNFYGVGMDEIESVERGDATTLYDKTNIYFINRLLWEVKPNFYVGPVLDVNYSNSWNLNPVMAENDYVNRYSTKYTNIGLGAQLLYDSRNDVATPTSGLMLSATGKAFGRYLGGTYNYQLVDLEYRQFQPLFGRATLAWVARTQFSYGDIPFTQLPNFGSPFDLRGFFWGKYRDRSMGYGIAEFRHMLGSQAAVNRGNLLSKLGYVLWLGTGTLGDSPAHWDKWKVNYGAGLRIQIQPGKNFRLDIGKGVGDEGVLVYFNMTEAF